MTAETDAHFAVVFLKTNCILSWTPLPSQAKQQSSCVPFPASICSLQLGVMGLGQCLWGLQDSTSANFAAFILASSLNYEVFLLWSTSFELSVLFLDIPGIALKGDQSHPLQVIHGLVTHPDHLADPVFLVSPPCLGSSLCYPD